MDTAGTFSEWRVRILVRSSQVHQRWRSRWQPRLRRLFPVATQSLVPTNIENVVLSGANTDQTVVTQNISAENTSLRRDTTDEVLPSDVENTNEANDNEIHKTNEENVLDNTRMTDIKSRKDHDTGSSKSDPVEVMDVDALPAVEQNCSNNSPSQGSISEEINVTPAIIETCPVVSSDDGANQVENAPEDGLTQADDSSLGLESPLIRVIPPALALNVRQGSGSQSARKSPVTVQEWVDSLPPLRLRSDDNNSEPWATGTGRSASTLVREPSVQSDAGSHCSSVESLLGSRRADPEEILMGLGFGGSGQDCDSDVSRIPRRFLRPSKVKGVAIDDFLKHQHDLVQTFESGFYGYRGLTELDQFGKKFVYAILSLGLANTYEEDRASLHYFLPPCEMHHDHVKAAGYRPP